MISIIGVLLSIGIGSYLTFARSAEIKGMMSRFTSTLRLARNTTLYEGAPAAVLVSDVVRIELRDPVEFIEGEVIDRKKGVIKFVAKGSAKILKIPARREVAVRRTTRVRPVGFRTVGAWHMEEADNTIVYLGRHCRVDGGEVYFGKIGSGVKLNEGGHGNDRIVALRAPDDAADPFMLPKGGRIELWVYAFPANADGTLVKRKGSYKLRVLRDGKLEGGPPSDIAQTDGYAVPLGRWVEVVLMFSAETVTISADGVVRAFLERDNGTLDPPEDEELVFGEHFSGVVDQIRVQRRVEDEAFDLPDTFELAGPSAVVFDSWEGRLDPRVHTAPVTFTLSRGEKTMSVTVGMNGFLGKVTGGSRPARKTPDGQPKPKPGNANEAKSGAKR